MKTTRVICYHQTGIPSESICVEEWSVPVLQPGEVLVEMKLAPINPADINLIEGKYGRQSSLPAVGGNEGVGVVKAICGNVERIRIGDVVLPPIGCGTWRQYLVVPASQLIKLSPGLNMEQAAMLSINPPTAWRLLHDFVSLKEGDWIIQNAANSAVGRCVIQIARHLGLHTLNIVRRQELMKELQREGADMVLVEGTEDEQQIHLFTRDKKIRLGLNAVGGESVLRLANHLAPHGILVTYGAMSKQPLRIPNSLLIFKDIRFVGFWLTRWYQSASEKEKTDMARYLMKLSQAGRLRTKVEKIYSMEEARQAIGHAQQSGRNGKILFCLNEIKS